MPSSTYILALDQGTTSTRAIVFDGDGQPVSSSQAVLVQHYPKPGWVEHDPEAIADAAITVCRKAVENAGLDFADITCIGITNQRETTVVWERESGRPVANAIVWQCRRTSEACRQLAEAGYERDIRQTTGLVLDPYFSATKIRWLLDWLPNGQRMAEDGQLCFGTVDSWLIHRLTAGAVHATDVTNASRTMLLNLHDLQWDPDLLSLFDIPEAMLPEVRPSAGAFGVTDPSVFGVEIPITGVAGDQHAALYGQSCHEQGMAKTTYGTGAFILSNAGTKAPLSPNGLLATLGWQVGARRVYALEGSIFIAGAAIQWLRDELGVLESAEQSDGIADSVEDNGGVYFVPAFTRTGLAALGARSARLDFRTDAGHNARPHRPRRPRSNRVPGARRGGGHRRRGTTSRVCAHHARRWRPVGKPVPDAVPGGHPRPAGRGFSDRRDDGVGSGIPCRQGIRSLGQ